jgi:hypothetical protein|uniref:RRM domain-containing protein n=1 Tax=Picea sitchensis TaxID=3332 RepID=C0PSM7_PICSI|nr:unknown [Picea sitchensis]
MGDAYWRYAAERGGLPPAGGLDLAGIQTSRDYPGYLPRESSQPTGRDFPGFLPREISQPVGRDIPGYLPRENPQLNDRIAHSMLRTHDPLGAPSETLRNGISPYGAGGLTASEISSLGGGSGIGVGGLSGGVGPGGGSRIGLGGVAAGAGAGLLGPAPLNDPVLMGQRQGGVGIDPALARLPDSAISGSTFRLPDHLKPDESSNTIFIEGLPADCSRREVAHIFRPFIGYKQIKVIHKEPRRAGGEPYVLCFVEFTDAKCALTALSALKGYKFDEHEHDSSSSLKLQLANFPGSRPAVTPLRDELLRH